MDKLSKLISICKCGVFITANQHRDYYQSAAEKIEELSSGECPDEIDEETRAKIIETNTIIEGQCYPDTPIGSYSVTHWDLDVVLDRLIAAVEKN